MSELSLVLFTVLVQAAIGMFLVLGAIKLGKRGVSAAEAKALDRAMLFVWPLFVVGLLASVMHLARPSNGINVILGLGHLSALSLEVMACSAFGAVAGAYTFVTLTNRVTGLHRAWLLLSMVLGVAAIAAMVNLYQLDAVAAWNSAWTPVQFTLTTLTLGLLGAFIALAWQADGRQLAGARWWPVLALLSLCALLFSIPGYQGWLAGLDIGPQLSSVLQFSSPLVGLRIAAIVAALLLVVVALLRADRQRTGFLLSAFLIVLVAEVAGRAYFVDLRVLTGM